ncbi:MAG: hypothetical protein Q4C70_15170 [Planctomycetia bacterium]|nr:hypothetical protein [Planctomycetia bacterium]
MPKDESQWLKLSEKIERIYWEFRHQSERENLEQFAFQDLQCYMKFHESAQKACKGESIVFSSVCSQNSPYYWQTELWLVTNPSISGSIELNVKNNTGDFISDGIFAFGDHECKILNGQGTMSLNDFRKNIESTVVRFIFPDGNESKGKLLFYREKSMFNTNLEKLLDELKKLRDETRE